MKKVMFVGGLASLALVVTGCGQQVSDDAVMINEVSEEVVVEEVAIPQDEYIVDPSDMLDGNHLIEDIAEASISDQEKEDLLMMREEEKLARDVYEALYEKWGVKVFSNIARSENTHTSAVKTLLDRYNIEDPVTSDERGVFTDDAFTSLYDDLVAQGSESFVAALQVGATVEDLDIKDLQEAIERTDNADIINVYENLMRGSRNHMRAFVGQLEREGETYSAQYLTQEEVDTILASDQERGDGGGNGQGGNGQHDEDRPRGGNRMGQ